MAEPPLLEGDLLIPVDRYPFADPMPVPPAEDIPGLIAEAKRQAAIDPAKRGMLDKLLGLSGERYQMWPEVMARSAFTLPRDVMTGAVPTGPGLRREDYTDIPGDAQPLDQLIERAQETAGLAMTGVFPGMVGASALGTAGSRLTQPQPKAPPFYSAVEEVVAASKQASATGDQWLGTIRNAPGVKKEELDWMGLDEFLGGRKAENIPKQEVQDWIAGNKVEIKEVEKGELPTPRMIERGGPAYPGVTKFQSYQLPGGENYRELLLTLPMAKKPQPAEPIKGWTVETKRSNDFTGQRDVEVFDAAGQSRGQRSGFLGTDEEVIRDFAVSRQVDNTKEAEAALNFRSGHWDEPNVVAHARINDRIIDGKKTMFVEELQSDWHQKGRREGYNQKVAPEKKTELVAERDTLSGEVADMPREANFSGGPLYPEWERRMDRITEINRLIGESGGRVPDAPFKTTWPDLTLKRLVRKAAEEGYDQIAWTPGKVQAERYDLSKQVSKVHYNPESGKLWGYDKNGAAVIDTRVPEGKLPDYVGKDIADKLLAAKADKGWHQLEGESLKVDAPGMIGFYDKMLPKIADKLFGKYGAKVETGKIGAPTLEEAPSAAGTYGITERAIGGYRAHVGDDAAVFSDWGDALKWVKDRRSQPVHVMKITPQLRDAALGRGFPLFSGGAVIIPVEHDPFKGAEGEPPAYDLAPVDVNPFAGAP